MISESSSLVYMAICSTCNEEYIGETGEKEKQEFDFIGSTYVNHIFNS